jgi:hypothetical protein
MEVEMALEEQHVAQPAIAMKQHQDLNKAAAHASNANRSERGDITYSSAKSSRNATHATAAAASRSSSSIFFWCILSSTNGLRNRRTVCHKKQSKKKATTGVKMGVCIVHTRKKKSE